MRSGLLNSRITFYKYDQLSDGAGGVLPDERVDLLTTNANVTPLKQDRTVQGNQQELLGGYQIIIRYRRDFAPLKTMFIDYRGVKLTITSIQQMQEDREKWLIIGMVS